MNIESYLTIIESYIDKNFRSVLGNLPEIKPTKIVGFALTHIAPVAGSDPEKTLIRESAFYRLKDLKPIFVRDSKVAADIYICPLAISDSGLVMQVHIDRWGNLSELSKDIPFIRISML